MGSIWTHLEKGLPRLQGAEEGEQEICGKHLILLLVSLTFTPSPDGLSGGGGISGMTGSGFKETTLSICNWSSRVFLLLATSPLPTYTCWNLALLMTQVKKGLEKWNSR